MNGARLPTGAEVQRTANAPSKADHDQTEHNQSAENGHSPWPGCSCETTDNVREMESVHGIPLRHPLTILLPVSDRPDFRIGISEIGFPGGDVAIPCRNRRYRRIERPCAVAQGVTIVVVGKSRRLGMCLLFRKIPGGGDLTTPATTTKLNLVALPFGDPGGYDQGKDPVNPRTCYREKSMKIRICALVAPVLLAVALPSLAAPRDDSAAEKLGFGLSLQC